MRIGRRSRLLLRVLFGVRDDTAFVDVDDEIRVRFGWYRFGSPVANVASWRIEGPWLWITAIGLRRSFRHGDVSFAGSPRGGVRLDFRDRVPAGPVRVPAIYVGVEDLEAFAGELAGRGIPGEDARTASG